MSNTTTPVKTRKPGSGRTVGSYSFVVLTLADLKKKFADDETPIMVSRKWAENVGFKGVTAKPVSNTVEKIEGSIPENKPAIKIVEFTD